MHFFEDIYIAALNFVARDNLDPLLQLALRLMGAGNEQLHTLLYASGQSVIFGFGVYLLMKVHQGTHGSFDKSATAGRDFLAIIFALLSLIWCCANPWLLTLHWFPMLLATAYRLECNKLEWGKSIISHTAFVAVLYLWLWTAGSLAILGCCVAAVWIPLRRYLSGTGSISIPVSYLPLLLIAGGLALLSTPEYPMPDYPPGARVTPISHLQLAPRPLLGKWLEPSPLKLEAYEQFRCLSFLGFTLLLAFFALSIAALAFSRQSYLGPVRQWRDFYTHNHSNLRAMLWVCLIAILIGSWRSIFGTIYPPLIDYDPLATLYRVVPGFALSPFPFWIFYFAYILLIDLFVSMYDPQVVKARGLIVLGNVIALGIFALHYFQPLSLAAARVGGVDDIQNSPSGAILRQHGKWAGEAGVAHKRSFENLRRLKSGIDFVAHASASPNNKDAELALDGQHVTRWRTARPQSKGDYFQIAFEKEIRILRAVFSIQHTPTDFPRAFRVMNLKGETLLSFNDWPGALHWTAGDYPYYGPQSEVVLDFPVSTQVKGLKLELISGDDTFDWSVSEIKLYND